MTGRVATGPGWELREGDHREVLADVEACDALIMDPPFSARVHKGQRTGSSTRKTTLTYDAITEEAVHAFVNRWSNRVRWWSIVFSDHLAQRSWEAAWLAAGWYTFAPLPVIRSNPAPRIAGDGPTSAADHLTIATPNEVDLDDPRAPWVTVARPRHRIPRERQGSRRGYYDVPAHGGRETKHPGAKSLETMRAIIRDYTLPGDTVVDAFAGSGTTILAAATEGRFGIGAEVAPRTFDLAAARLRKGFTPDLFAALGPKAAPVNLDLFPAEEAAAHE